MRVWMRASAGDHARGRRAAPLFVHAVGGIDAQLEKSSGIDQQFDALARSEASFVVLVFDGFCAAAFANLFAFIAHLRHEIGQEAHVGLEARRGGVDLVVRMFDA